jgi:hypothetical protein
MAKEPLAVQEKTSLFKGIARLKRHHQFLFGVIITLGLVSFWEGYATLLEHYFLAVTGNIGAWILTMLGLLILLSSDHFARLLSKK